MDKTCWQKFFDWHAPDYMDNCFVTNTLAEVDFLLEELNLPAGSAILDIGCGTGRHSVELAKRGFRMTGIDLSTGMLAQARKAADEAGVEIELIRTNAADFRAEGRFDAAICLCEGAFCLIGAGDDAIDRDLKILRNIEASIKPGGKLVLTALNGFKKARQFTQADVEAGVFDPLTLSETCVMEWDGPEGKERADVIERGYMPSELTLLCRCAGLDVLHVWGGTAGNWGRRAVDLDEMEIMVIARKAG